VNESDPTPEDATVGAPPATGSASVFAPGIVMRNYFSSHLLWMALHATERARAIEAAHAGRSAFDIEHRAHVLSAIVGSVAFLEATANELFQDADDRHGITDDGYLVPLDEATVGAMAAWWQGTDGLRGMNVLGKWELLLVCAGKHALNRGAAPYQDAQFVVRLRNAVVHYRSENVSADSTHDMEAWLRGKFDDSRLMVGSGNPWWPDHCLGHGCAAWATRSAVAFADRVSDELGLRPNYRRVCP
jgi:hypothetical protein